MGQEDTKEEIIKVVWVTGDSGVAQDGDCGDG